MKEKILAANAAYEKKVIHLLEQISQLPEVVLNEKPADGGWSAFQIMHHLMLSEELSLAYVRKKLSFTSEFSRIGWRESLRSLMVQVYLYIPLKLKAPAIVGGNPEVLPDKSDIKTVTADWINVRAQWADFLDKMPENLADKSVYKHILAGKIGWLHMILFFNAHFTRHLRQLRRILKNQKNVVI